MGRDPDCDVFLDDPAVSRKHALLVSCGSRWVVVDYKSSNGVLLNDRAVLRADLRSGDRLRIGDSFCDFRIEHHFKLAAHDPLPDAEALLFSEDFHPFIQNCLVDLTKEKESAYAWLFRFARGVRGDETTAELLDAILSTAVEALGGAHGFLALHDRSSEEIHVVARSHLEAEAVQNNPFFDLLIRQAFVNLRAVMTTAALFEYFYQDPRIIFLGIQSALCVPLLRPGGPFGVLYVDRAMTARPFRERHLKALAFFAYAASLRLESRLFLQSLEESLQAIEILGTEFGRNQSMFCEVCGERIDRKDLGDLVLCLRCNAIHHRECWNYNKGCAIYGCQGKAMKTLDEL